MEETDDPPGPLFVPVRRSQVGTLTPMTARLHGGPRVGVGFTSRAALQAASGPRQDWIRLTEFALRGLLTPLGIDRIQIDPVLVTTGADQTTRVRDVAKRTVWRPAHVWVNSIYRNVARLGPFPLRRWRCGNDEPASILLRNGPDPGWNQFLRY